MTAARYLSHAPAVYLSEGTASACCIARFDDGAPDIGRYARGVLFVGYDPKTLRVFWTEGVRLRDDSDAVDYAAMLPRFAALLRATTPTMTEPLPSIEADA